MNPMHKLTLLAILSVLCLQAQFNRVLQLSLNVPETIPEAQVTVGKKGAPPALTLALGKTFTVSDNAQQLLTAPLTLTPGKHTLQLWFSNSASQLTLDDAIIANGKTTTAIPQRPAITSSLPTFTEATKPSFQRYTILNFQDDFARDSNDGATQWTALSGTFALNMNINPGSAQGAFQLFGAASDGEAIAVADASKWFWRDLRYGASAIVPQAAQAWGLIFAFRDKDNFYRFECSHADGARLIRRQAGKDTILQTAPCQLHDAWTRAEIIAVDSTVTAWLGGKQVLQFKADMSFAGQIGLYLKRTEGAYFDDITVNSCNHTPEVFPAPFGPSEQHWTDFSGKHFFTDAYMSQWAHPRSFWNDGPDKLLWFRSRLFDNVDFSWTAPEKQPPLTACRIRAFADSDSRTDGLLLAIDNGKATLSHNGTAVTTANVPSPIAKLKFTANATHTTLLVNGQPVLHQELALTARGFFGADFGTTSDLRHLSQPDWRDTALVSSTHRLDYSFEHAPTAWYPQAGSWKATHRWACVPKWSFFAGRGIPGPTEVKHGNAVLWNLRQITGDFDLEIFAAPMEGTPQRAHFTYPISINLAFAADGAALDSGYNFINGIYDFPSELFFKGTSLGTNGDRVEAGLRRHELFWYRRVTQVWQHLRIQRRNGRILVDSSSHNNQAQYHPLARVFDQPDQSKPDEPSQFAIWTWGENGLAIARASLSFQNSPGAAQPPADLPAPQRRNGDGKTAPATYTHVVNPISGGQFATTIYDKPFNLKDLNTVKLLVRPDANTHVSLIATINGQAAELPISGPIADRDYTFPLASQLPPDSKDFPGWKLIDINLQSAIKDSFESDEPLICSALTIASPYDSLQEIAGLNINRRGATVDYTDVELSKQDTVTKLTPSPLPDVAIYDRPLLTDFELTKGDIQRFGGPDGAALLRLPAPHGGRALRLLNQNVGGTAGIILTDKPFSLTAFPKLAFDYAIPPGIEIDLIVETDPGPYEITLTGTDDTWGTVGSGNIVHDGKWHHTELDLAAMFKPHLKTPIIRRMILADPFRMSSYQRIAYWLDNVQLIPAVSNGTQVSVANAQVDSIAVACDKQPQTAPDMAKTVKGTAASLALPAEGASWLHIAMHTAAGWSPVRHLRVETAPQAVNPAVPPRDIKPAPQSVPLISYIPSDRLIRSDMEQDFGNFEIRREAWAIRNTDTAATGKACVELVNLNHAGFCSIFLRKPAWDVKRWPCISFNYRFLQPGCALNLSLLVNDAMTIVEWTGPNANGGYFWSSIVGKAEPYALQDGAWHETQFDLRDMLQKTRFKAGLPPTGVTATELSVWATQHNGHGYVNPHNARVFFDNFTIFSNRGKDPAFEWSFPNAKGYAVVFDQTPETVPAEKVTHDIAFSQYKNTAPGTWYIHVRACCQDTTWTPTAHYKITIEP